MVAERWTLRPNMQLSGRGRAENRLVRLPEIHRLLRAGRRAAVNFKHAEMNTFWEWRSGKTGRDVVLGRVPLQLGGPKNNAI